VSLKKDRIFSLTIPAKVQSYLACGKPIIASIDGEGAKIVINANCGLVSPAENYLKLSENIKGLMDLDKSVLNEMGINARAYYDKEFDKAYLLDKLEDILNS
jgi:glycosyltransferase involved in cell wall biosynthesis